MSIKENLQKQLESSLEKWKSEIDEAEAKARAARADADAQEARADLEKALWTRVEDLRAKARDAVKSAESCDDVKTADLLTERIGQHEENSWMLRSLLA